MQRASLNSDCKFEFRQFCKIKSKFKTQKYDRGHVFQTTLTKKVSMMPIEYIIKHLHTYFMVRDEENVQRASHNTDF